MGALWPSAGQTDTQAKEVRRSHHRVKVCELDLPSLENYAADQQPKLIKPQ